MGKVDYNLKNMSNIQAIIFDLVGVLVFKRRDYVPESKEQLSADKIEKLYNHLDDKKLLFDIKEKLGLADEEIEKVLACIPQKYEKNEELWKLLPELKKKYKLAIINNGNSLALKYWNKIFNFEVFDFFINSAIEGFKKPNHKIYLIACKKLKVNPKNCLFIDDLEANIKTAKRLGMETIWWKKDKKEENLKNFNIKTQ
ncbi:MAG: HAD-IA family hydrolase [Candidatus Nealsonbacteria bacterium]|nr:HAD-IA family hydrolase [Candidatus Nealsonbacteria bacterium]